MIIVADENIPLLESFFADLAEVRAVSGRKLSPRDIQDADILLVRSVTRVDRSLLEGSRVRFVGTCTIGTDHVDTNYLAESGVAFASAPGCNANSVVEYVLSIISLRAEKLALDDWSDLSVGIVGAGNVGGLLAQRLERLGFEIRVCDPPRERCAAENADDTEYVSLDEALECDVVSLHTPLNRAGEHPTYHLLNAGNLKSLGDHQLLINTSRGEVVDSEALLDRLEAPSPPTAVLDVWENEPMISAELLDRVWIGTPHIAGYSLEGKVQGSEMIYQSLCRFLGLPARKKAGQFLPEPGLSKLSFTSEADEMSAASTAIRSCIDPRRDDSRLRLTMRQPPEERSAAFDHLRRHYPIRREFSSVKIQLRGPSKSAQDTFKALGFKLKI